MTPQETVTDLTGVSSRSVGRWWPAAGLGALSVAVSTWDLLKEVTVIFITSTIISVQFSSVNQTCPTFCDPMNRSMPGLIVHHHLPEFKLTSMESVMPSSHLILSHPLFLLPSVFPSIRVFSNGPPYNSAHHTVLLSSPIIAPDKASKFYSSVASSWQVRCPWPSKVMFLFHFFNLASKEDGCFFSNKE